MPLKQILQSTESQELRRLDRLRQLRSALTNRKLAMQHVFAATHGRPMTNTERRMFKEFGKYWC